MKANKKLLVCAIGAVVGMQSATAAVTCVENKSTGKFEEKASKRAPKVTGECDAQISMAMVSSLDELEAVAKAEGTRVIGGVIVTNAAQPFDVAPAKKEAPKSFDAVDVDPSLAATGDAAANGAKQPGAQLAQAAGAKRDAGVAPAGALVKPIEPVKPVEAPKPVPSWTLTAGHTVGKDLQEWAVKAGWRVVWNLPKDWSIPASTTFHGNFKEAASSVIKNLAANGALIRAQFYDGNNTLVVNGPGAASQ